MSIKNLCFSIQWHTCDNHQLLQKPISVAIVCSDKHLLSSPLHKHSHSGRVKIIFFTVATEKHWNITQLLVLQLWSCLFSVRCTNLCDKPMIRVAWHWLLWVPGSSSCDWQSCSTSVRFSSLIAVLRLVVPVWRYFAKKWLMLRQLHCLFVCNPSTSPSFSVKHVTLTAKSSFEKPLLIYSTNMLFT